MSIYFSQLRSPQIAEAAQRGAVPVLPVGQTEEHGSHLPINTDALVAQRVCEEAVRRLDGQPPAYVLDTVWYGYSQKAVQQWPGTFVVPQCTVIEMVTSLVVSLIDMGFRKVAVVSTHGNHLAAMRAAAREVADRRGVGPGMFFPYATLSDLLKEKAKAEPGGSCHAGELETSLMLHLAPELVDMSAATADDRITALCPYGKEAFVSTWTRQKSKSGVYGDPTVANAEFGEELFEKMVDETAGFIRYYHELKQP